MAKRRMLALCGLLVLSGLLLPARAQFGYYFGRNKVHYENFDWHILKTEHFDVYYYEDMEELAKQGAYFAEEAHADLQKRFNYALNRRVPLIFYSSNIHFKQTNTTPGFIPDGVGGFFEFLKGRVVIPANGDLHRFRRVIRHEMVHVFTHARVLRSLRDHRVPPDRFLPLWFTEGLAEYWSGEPDYQHEMMIRDALFSNYLVPLEDIDRIAGTYLMYKQGEAICRFISETYGEEKVLDLVDGMWKDRDFRVVMESTLRDDFDVIAERWMTWLKKQYYPILEASDQPSYLSTAVGARGFQSKPAYYRFRDGSRKVYFMGNETGYTNVYQVEVDSLYQPLDKPRILIHGERSNRFEAFHLFESRISVSRDGKLAFVSKSGERDVIHVYDLEQDRLEDSYGFEGLVAVYSPDWNPDGTALVFSSIARSGYADLYLYDLPSRRLEKLTNDTYDDRDPSWSPDGRFIAFSSDRTSEGKNDAFNLFTYDVKTGAINYVTFGDQYDFSPRWSPDGQQILYVSTRTDSTGKYDAQNIWMVEAPRNVAQAPVVASSALDDALLSSVSEVRKTRKLTAFTAAAYDPHWTPEGSIVFTAFQNYRFTIRSLPGADSLLESPRKEEIVDVSEAGEHWHFASIGIGQGAEKQRYRRKYNLDVAQGQVNQNPVWGTTGGAVLAFSDMLGDDYWYVALYNTAQAQSDFLRSMNVAVTRVQLHSRTQTAYGVYRYGGLRYDITDPDAQSVYPIFWETMYGGFASLAYPLSMFQRVEVSSSINWSDKEISLSDYSRKALLLSNGLSLVHDNTIWDMNGPAQGWRASVGAAYTTDVLYSNVSYFTLTGDVRHYLRLGDYLTLASWGMGRLNQGKEARLFILGGSWDLRGYRMFGVRGRKMWFTSHELRFPIVNNPALAFPLLGTLGVAGLRGALFIDAAHVWNEGYHDRQPLPLAGNMPEGPITTGQTLGSYGLGFRLNLFGGFVLRYDLGYRFRDGFRDHSNHLFKQFFFGWDF